ncbi:MAG: DUF1016 N-terminal domain-containing protein [Bacteroidales bacterium]|jgi:predicted nuclease of restriction endonuclease-like (RecB) superfamily|nr:DUF1016 N-terminal domain-containing protein [Bacteroidales bacterium]
MSKGITTQKNNLLFDRISSIIEQARQKVVTAVNLTMVYTYYEIGRYIVEDEQQGEQRAEYGETVLKDLAEKLTEKFGRGFSYSNLRQIRQFYTVFSKRQTLSVNSEQERTKTVFSQSEIIQTLSEESQEKGNTDYPIQISETVLRKSDPPKFVLSWSHYIKLMRIADPLERSFYEIEATNNRWSLRELQRQCDSALYQRLALSKDKEGVLRLAKRGQIIEKPEDALKDPLILEFTGFPENYRYSENELEEQLINKLEILCSNSARVLLLRAGKCALPLMKNIFVSIWHFLTAI